MSKEFKLTSIGYEHNDYLKDKAKLEKFIFNHFNIKPIEDGKLESREIIVPLSEMPTVEDMEISNTTIQIDEGISDCFKDDALILEDLDKPQPKKEQRKEKKEEQPPKKEEPKANDYEEDTPEESQDITQQKKEQPKINDIPQQPKENDTAQQPKTTLEAINNKKPIREICDEFHRILSLALLNRLTSGEESKTHITDEDGKIILDSTSLVELISLITGVERRKIVIHYRDQLPPDVGCFCSAATSDKFTENIKDIKDIKVNNEDMIYSYNAHYNALTEDFHISLNRMIHYNETQ